MAKQIASQADTIPPEVTRPLLAAALRSERNSWTDLGHVDTAQLLQAAVDDGVLPLLYSKFRECHGSTSQPQLPSSVLTSEVKKAVALDAWQQYELILVLSALAKRGIHPLLMKGAALAYSHYAEPYLRPRGDSDFLLPKEQIEPARLVLSTMGYREPNAISGDLVTGQFSMIKGEALHCCDIHWKISNALPFAALLSYREAAQDAVTIPGLGPHALGLSPTHALLLACVHRVAHHHNSERLIWLYDIHLLANTMSAKGLREFVELALAKDVGTVCERGLQLAYSYFKTYLPQEVMHELHTKLAQRPQEPTSVDLNNSRRRIDRLLSDLRALPAWSQKIRLLCEHAFPPRAYMLRRYQKGNTVYLPLLYVHRLVHALRKLSHPS